MEVQNIETGFDLYNVSYNDDILRTMAMEETNSEKDQEVWTVSEDEEGCNTYIEEYE